MCNGKEREREIKDNAMTDEVFSTTLAYTKSPKVTKRTSFQVKYLHHIYKGSGVTGQEDLVRVCEV